MVENGGGNVVIVGGVAAKRIGEEVGKNRGEGSLRWWRG